MKIFILLIFSSIGFMQTNLEELIDVREIIPGIKVDIRYSTPNNFASQKLYASNICYLSLGLALKLKAAQDSLKKSGFELLLLDGYRPRTVQWLLWEIYPDSNFVADPRKGSRHNRGSAVDLTIIETKTGKELDLGTPFDFFGDQAAHGYKNLPEKVLANRKLLKEMMVNVARLDAYEYEWWHYNYREGAKFPLKDYQTVN